MKTMKRVVGVMACGVALFATVGTAAAETEPGFYLGVSGGQSKFKDMSQGDFDDILLGVFFDVGAPVISGTSTFDESAKALSIFGGYQFNPYIAVEGAYLDLGAAEYRFRGQVNPPGPITAISAALSMDLETTGFTISGIGSLPLSEMFDLHGRLGFFIADTELKVGSTIGGSSASDTEKLDSTSVLFGVGGAVHIGTRWSVSLDWTRYDNVGDEDEDDDADTEAGFDVDMWSLSGIFRF